MGAFASRNHFPVDGKTIIITGGSQGMGKSVAIELAKKGANIVIVARNLDKLKEAISQISSAAIRPASQRFDYMSADLTSPIEASEVISQVSTWNNNQPPDIIWCVAGSSHPSLFIDVPIEKLDQQMNSNYFSSAYIAHAALRRWLGKDNPSPNESKPEPTTAQNQYQSLPQPRHLIFTSSVVAFYPLAGYSAYSPSKTALRSLSDTLSQELLLYPDSPTSPSIKLHTVFPGTILTAAYEEENKIKHPLTLDLEKDDPGQTPDQVARASIRGLEKGEELITTGWLGWGMKVSTLGASRRNGWLVGDTLGAWAMGLFMIFVRWDMDNTVIKWGRTKGP